MIHILSLGIPSIQLQIEIINYVPKGEPVEIIQFSGRGTTAEIAQDFKEQAQADFTIVCNAAVFKAITRLSKAEPYLGTPVPSPYSTTQVVYCPNPKTIFTNPQAVRAKIQLAIQAIAGALQGTSALGTDIIHSGYYPDTFEDIQQALEDLLQKNVPLTVDIETFSLKHYNAGIGSIAFAWNKHEGISFLVDYYGYNAPVRALLKDFFLRCNQKKIFHNAGFDVTVLVYQLFMEELVDTEGLLQGLEVLTTNLFDTKLIAYLATNTCAGNALDLKSLSQEFTGNYAEDVKNIRKIPTEKLLKYNLVDCLATWHVYDKYYPRMLEDQQAEVYSEIFAPALIDVIQMQLTGLPIDLKRVAEVKQELQQISNTAFQQMSTNPLVASLVQSLNDEWVITRNAKLKKKRVTLADANVVFNPNSPNQLVRLLYSEAGLPILETTDAGNPSADADTLEALLVYAKHPDAQAFLESLLEYKKVDKILTTFIPAFEQAVCAEDGQAYLYGSFNLGATKSGRLSSSVPNLQQLPSKGKMGKLIKSCFVSTSQWLFCGLDYDALEDKISALTTKDPAKLQIYLNNYDGHSLRALAYSEPDEMLDIKEALSECGEGVKYFRRTNPDGSVDYFTEPA